VTRRVSSGAPWEALVRYSRAVAAGDYAEVEAVAYKPNVGW